jgi:1,4-dihydroxy-2-naphthoate octaprenyltransferase
MNFQLESFAARDPRLKAILEDFYFNQSRKFDGVINSSEKIYRYIPLDPVNSLCSPSRIVFEVRERNSIKIPHFIKRWWVACRPLSLASSVGPCAVTLLLGLYLGLRPNYFYYSLSVLGVLLLHIGVCFINDYEDHMRLFDLSRLRGVRGTGGSGVIQNNWITARKLKSVGRVLIFLGACCGLPVFLKYPVVIGALGVIAALGVLSYSGTLKTAYRALGDGAVILLLGPGLSIGISIATFGVVTLDHLVAGLLFGFLAEGVLHANNLQDIPLDTSRNIKTIAKTIGFKGAKDFLIFIYVFCFGLSVVLAYLLRDVYGLAVSGHAH